MALGVTVTVAGCAVSPGSPDPPGRGSSLGPTPLGVNVAAWDSSYGGATATTINALLRAADLRLLRYPGGSWADEYDWITNSDSSRCTPSTTSSCSARDPLDFDTFSAQAHSAGASTFVTVNYGSGTPAEAAAWVAHAERPTGRSVALWEVGNENYSCSETNHHLEGSPTFVQGFTAEGPVCPKTTVMAASYAANVGHYLVAMKAVDPRARIGVPWAFEDGEARGSGVSDAAAWNRTVLRKVQGGVSFVDAHWYPFDATTGLTDRQILDSIHTIPSAAERIRSTLHRYSPDARIVVGETNISDRLTTLDFQPVAALFAAGTSLEWLANGASSVDWWNLNNFGSPEKGDYGILSSGGPEPGPPASPLPPYYGELLASKLAVPGARLITVPTGSPTVLGFESDSHGVRRVLLINADASTTVSMAPRLFSGRSDLRIDTYSGSSAAGTNPIVHSTAPVDGVVPLPALSIVVLSGTPRT